MSQQDRHAVESALVEMVMGHLQEIARGTCSIAEEALQGKDDDPMSELLIGLLHLHETIQFQKDELQQLHRQEEKLAVAEATAALERQRSEELQSLNQQLRASEQQLRAANQQLHAREQALRATQDKLQGKLAEMTSFNRLMVDRELRMVELKKEVNSLLKEAGQAEKYEVF